jgi:arginyl-tRNA synthetase
MDRNAHVTKRTVISPAMWRWCWQNQMAKIRANWRKMVAILSQSDVVSRVDIAGPGFINFTLKAGAQFDVVKTILSAPENLVVAISVKTKKC